MSFPRVNSQESTHLGVYDLAEYDGKLYYYEKDKCYLFSSRIDGTDQKVLIKLKSTPDAVTVNRFGIFVLFLKSKKIEVQIFTHQGKENCCIPIDLSGTLSNSDSLKADYCPYICGDKLFFIIRKQNIYKAIFVQLNIKGKTYTEHIIYEGQHKQDRKNGIESIFNPTFIMGGSDFALICVSYDYKYKPRDYSANISINTSSWFYVSLSNGKTYCLSNRKYTPELIKDRPDVYCKYLELPEAENDWYKIAHFDIENNLIWIYKNMKDSKQNVVRCLIPYDLRPDFIKHPRNDFKIWGSNPEIDEVTYNGKYYFDGLFRFSSDSYSSFYSFEKSGKKNKWSGSHGTCCRFSVQAGTLFLDSDLTNEASQLDLTHYQINGEGIKVPCKLRPDWTRWNGTKNYKGNELIEQFENEQKQKKKTVKSYTTPTAAPNVSEPKFSADDYIDFQKLFFEEDEKPTQTSPIQQSNVHKQNTPKTFLPDNKLDYWEGLGNYLQGKLPSIVRIPKAADRSWYALRLGSSKVRIECSISVKNYNIRVGFFMKNSDSVYGKASQHKNEIDAILKSCNSAVLEIRWDNSVADANVSTIVSMNGLDRMNEYAIIKDIITGMTKIIDYIDI